MICTAVGLFLELEQVLRNSCEIPGSRLVRHVSSAAPFHSTIASEAGRYLAADISPVNLVNLVNFICSVGDYSTIEELRFISNRRVLFHQFHLKHRTKN